MPSVHADVCDLNRGWVGHLASFGLLARGAAVVLAVWGVLLWTLTLAGMMPRGAQVIYPRCRRRGAACGMQALRPHGSMSVERR